jgi:purine catabolism regulator
MPPTVRQLLQRQSLGVTIVTAEGSIDEPIQWISSTDLLDPTPFLSDDQMLLTTGTQFPLGASSDFFVEYVQRLAANGVRAIGFGTEVIRSGTPQHLVSACAEAGLPLVEVPYRTPFIAIIRWAADMLVREDRARDDWALKAQQSLSLAALGPGGVHNVLAELARQLECRVVMFDSAGNVTSVHPSDSLGSRQGAELAAEAVRLLSSGRRSSVAVRLGERHAVIQTLGSRDTIRGALAVADVDSLDAAAQSVVTAALALVAVSLEQHDAADRSVRIVREQMLHLLVSGHADAADRVMASISEPLPEEPVLVVTCDGGSFATPGPEASFERTAHEGEGRVFFARADDEFVFIVPAADRSRIGGLVDSLGLRAGVSTPAVYAEFRSGLDQARRALAYATRSGATGAVHSDLTTEGVFGLLERGDIARRARARLAPVLLEPDGRDLLNCGWVWLEHNALWGPAARALAIHRHGLRARVQRLAAILELDLDAFSGRAELWALLEAHHSR